MPPATAMATSRPLVPTGICLAGYSVGAGCFLKAPPITPTVSGGHGIQDDE